MIAAFAQGINPLGVPEPNPEYMLIDPKMAREIIASNLDVKMVSASSDEDEDTDADVDDEKIAESDANPDGDVNPNNPQGQMPVNTRLMVGDGTGSGAE
jgi:hypothetical protein